MYLYECQIPLCLVFHSNYLRHRRLTKQAVVYKNSVHAMADGDLTVNVKLDTRDEMQYITSDMNRMI